jgi:hypothetical protein
MKQLTLMLLVYFCFGLNSRIDFSSPTKIAMENEIKKLDIGLIKISNLNANADLNLKKLDSIFGDKLKK